MRLYEELCAYTPYNLQKGADREAMARYIKKFLNVYTRDNVYGHIAGSPRITSTDVSRVFVIYHNIYNSWGWCGGHADEDRDLVHVALKEGREGTGLKKLEPLSESILAIDIPPVPLHVKRGVFVSSHVYLNVTYLYQTDRWDMLCSKSDKSSSVRWIVVEEIDYYMTEEDMKPVYRKLVEESRGLLLTD